MHLYLSLIKQVQNLLQNATSIVIYFISPKTLDYGTESKRSKVTKAIVILLTILATALLLLLLHLQRMRIQKRRGRCVKLHGQVNYANRLCCQYLFANDDLKLQFFLFTGRMSFNSELVALNKIEGEDFEVPLFDFTEIANATNNFSDLNKLGEGGFGPVYKVIRTDISCAFSDYMNG